MTEGEIRIRPLAPELLPAWRALFGPKGACAGCWCTLFRLKPKERQAAGPDGRQARMEVRIRRGPPPGLVAMAGESALGWMQIGPRADVPEWNNRGRLSAPLPDAPAEDPGVWAITCFFFARAARGRGLSHRMVAAGIDWARANGARLIEAAPMDHATRPGSVILFVGSTEVFRRAGFAEAARRKPGRPLMRLAL